MAGPIVELQHRDGRPSPDATPLAIVVRTTPAVHGRTRGLAWFLVVVGVTGLAGLAVLRVPTAVHAAYLVFFAITAVVVWSDAQESGARVTGEIAVDPAGRRLRRVAGFPALGWQELVMPPVGVVVLEAVPGIDTKELVSELERPCRVIAVPTGDPIATWEAVAVVRRAPMGITVLDAASFDVARGVAEALGRAFGWDVIDVTAEPDRRAASELDTPLVDRADALARAIATEVPQRRPWGAVAWVDATGTHLGLRNIGLAGLVVQIALAIPLAGLLFLLSGGNAGIPMLAVALVGLRAGARTIVDLTPEHVAVRPLTVWLPLDEEVVLPWRQIEAVQAVTERGMVGLRVVSDAGSAFVPTASRAAARWAAMEIKRYLLARRAG